MKNTILKHLNCKFNLLRGFGFLFAVLIGIISCSKSGQDVPDEPTPPAVPDKIELAATTDRNPVLAVEGGTIEISFNASTSWTASAINDRAESWCSISPASGSAGAGKITVAIKENTDSDERSASVIIKAGTASETIKVTQKQKDALIVTSTKYEIPVEGGDFNVEIKANVSFKYTISADAKDWITYVGTKALSTSTMTFSVKKNESVEGRNGIIIVGEGALCDTVKVYQAGETPAIVLSSKEYIAKSEGETFSVDVSSNVDVDINILFPDGSPIWLNENKTKAMSTNTYCFTASANEEYDSREAKIIFTNKGKNISDTVKVIQLQKDAIVLAKSVYEIDNRGGSISVEIAHNIDYNVEVGADWITYVKTKGLTTEYLTFDIAENKTYDNREAVITFISADGTVTQKLKVCQSQVNAIIISKNDFKLNYNATQISVEVKSNLNLATVIEYTDSEGQVIDIDDKWISESTTKALTAYSYNFDITENKGFEDRFARIIFNDNPNNMSDTVNLVQYNHFYIKSSVSNVNIDVAGGFVNVSVDAGIEYDVIMPEVNWIANAREKNDSNNHQFKVDINHSDSTRFAEIIFASPVYQISDTLKIFQSGNAQFFILYDTIKLSYKETVFPVKMNYKGVVSSTTCRIDRACKWISRYSQTKADIIYSTDPVWFKVEENNTGEVRCGSVVFVDINRNLTDTLIIQQLPEGVEPTKNFSIRKKEFTVPMEAHKIPIIIEHDGPYYIDYEKQINSYNIVERESFSEGNVDYYFVNVREASVPRSFNVYVWNENRSICDTIKIHQGRSDEYMYAAKLHGQMNLWGIIVPYNGMQINYSVSTNLKDYELKQKPSSNGLLLTPQSRVKTVVGYDEYLRTPINNTEKSQSVYLYFIGENIAYIGEVVVKPKLHIVFDSAKDVSLTCSGGVFTANVWTNDDNLNIKVEGDNTGWLRMLNSEKDSRDDFTRIISTFEASPNATGKQREAYIVAYNGFGDTESIRIVQPSGGSILLSESLNYLGAWEQVLKVELVDCNYKVTVESGNDWVNIGQSEKQDGKIIQNLKIAENAANVERSATVVFTSDTIVNKVSLIQLPESDALVDNSPELWRSFQLPKVNFKALYPGSLGTMIYNAIVKDPEFLIDVESRKVLEQLYLSPDEPLIPRRKEIEYVLDNYDGISAYSSGSIKLSYQYVENYYKQHGVKKLVEENRGVLCHELTHSFQLRPKGVGDYSNPIYHACIEGMADAVRVLTGHFTDADRPKGGSYLNSYRYTGFFIAWLVKTKDKDFLRKFNMSTQYLDVWSFDGAIKYALGEQYNVDDLWKEYQKAMGDIK